MYLVTSEQMKQLDRYTIDQIGIPSLVLMENAGRAIAEVVAQLEMERGGEAKPWMILVGKGNNGGDGIVAARHLKMLGFEAELLYAVDPSKLGEEAAKQRDIAMHYGISATSFSRGEINWKAYAGIVDGLLGTGFSGSPREPYASLIREANNSGLPIVAIDIPSGVNADTGEIYDPCIRANVTIALAFMKKGLSQYPAADYCGEIKVKDIGIPSSLAKRFEINTMLSTETTISHRFGIQLPLVRPNYAHKGTFGHVLVAAGSMKYSGAGWLTTKAVLRAGAGLVTWAMPKSLVHSMAGHFPEAILIGVEDDNGSWSQQSAKEIVQLATEKSVLAIGPGIHRFEGEDKWLRTIWSEVTCPLVIDADALNILSESGGLSKWPNRVHPTVITPHPGEMARLVGISVHEVQRDRIKVAQEFAKKHQLIVVLKGARTVIAEPKGEVYINTTGNSGMAVGGSGDVLTGIIAGLAAQGFAMNIAAILGVYLHGHAGDRAAASRYMSSSLISSDILEAL